ncbi:TraB/GumN family protein [Mucilaginibacter sp. HC2]|uniref:TraB/GumN family protein n=1 Tax=Mucilaginibacter inviolabilis TaxID=2714892 RepID=UPI00140B82C9|nr:TraB/GumN family protein [Mucilaginibacter inviolabilis]NHA03612.1 TraB/GumN family protein [Mucilaginibacter inviolabilis]
MTQPYLAKLLQTLCNGRSILAILKRCALFMLFFFISVLTVTAQQKGSYTLLWRISGKGLAKPSYLFGTMHVKDKRAFGFSDSVMLAIQNTQAFALEVHPDTLIGKMFETIREKDSTRSIRKLLSKNNYDRLAKRFREKNGYPMGNIDPVQLESMMKPEKKKADDKKTVVDAYLYGVARGLGKNIYGLENTSQQYDEIFGSKADLKSKLEDLLDDNEEADLENTEQMTKIYSTGNLESILAFMDEHNMGTDEIIARNKVMANGMIQHMKDQSLFTAVGVAHLPGENGIISLLRKAGYTLTPVSAGFTGIANNYNTDYSKLQWQTYTEENNGYSIAFPFKPIKTNVFLGVSTTVYADIANDAFFGAFAIKKGSDQKPANQIEVMQDMINRFKADKKNNILSQKPVVIAGLKGIDIVMRSGNNVLKYRLLYTNNYLYCLYGGNNEATLNSAYADRFFNSFKSFKPTSKINPDWITIKNDTAAFSLHVPGQLKLLEKETPDPSDIHGESFKMKIYYITDTVNLENYIIRYNDYPAQKYLAYKSKVFDALVNEIKSKGTQVGKIKQIFKDGYEGREFGFMLAEKYNCKAQIFVRGNRIYLLMKQNLQEGSKEQPMDGFFESFKFLPYIKQTLKPFKIDDSAFSAAGFSILKTASDTTHDYTSFLTSVSDTYSTNPASGGLYILEHATINKYYRIKNVDSLYNYLIPKFVHYPDSLIKTDTILVNGLKGREFISEKRETKEKRRYRLFIDNGHLLYFFGFMANDELFDENNNAFYNSLIKTGTNPSIDLNASKAELITNGLLATDTSIYKAAHGALSYYKFEKEELPFIYKALDKKYADDTSSTGTRAKLVEVLEKVNDTQTISKLTSLFKNPDTGDEIKLNILAAIPRINKKEGYDIYLDLLTNSPVLKSENIYPAFGPLNDSIEYAAANFKRLIPLLKYPDYRKELLSITQQMQYTEVKEKYLPLLKTHFNDLTQYAQTDLDAYLSKTDTANNKWFSSGYYYLRLMQSVKNQPVTESFTAKFIRGDKTGNQLYTAVTTRLMNHLVTDQKLINQLMDSIENRYNLMETLNNEKQLSRVPLKYKSQAEFAKINLYQSLVNTDDDDMPQNITSLGTLSDKSGIYYVFKYNRTYSEENTSYIGICGPYSPASTKLDFSSYHAYFDGSVKKANWQQQAKGMIPKLKQQNKEELANAAK